MHADFDFTSVEPMPGRRRGIVRRLSTDWCAVERDYRTGSLSLREMSLKHGCSHSAIANRAGRNGWTRGTVLAATIST